MDGVRVANAPVTFGVFELSEGQAGLPGPDELAAAVARGGYTGIDLGPVGYLGRGEHLHDRLARHGLGLAGGFVPMRFTDEEAFAADLGALDEALDAFEAAPAELPRPKPTLADAGSPFRQANPGRGGRLPGGMLDETQWHALAQRVDRAAERVSERGFEPTFHHHACSYVETPDEIERLLDLTSVGLCLDTGHLLIGGGDPLEALRGWAERINHLHVKDCRCDVIDAIVAERGGMRDVWSGGAFCAIGDGDLDVAAFMHALRDMDYRGWLVVEQDTMPKPDVGPADIAAEQRANRDALARHGF